MMHDGGWDSLACFGPCFWESIHIIDINLDASPVFALRHMYLSSGSGTDSRAFHGILKQTATAALEYVVVNSERTVSLSTK